MSLRNFLYSYWCKIKLFSPASVHISPNVRLSNVNRHSFVGGEARTLFRCWLNFSFSSSGKLCWEAAHENVTNGTTQHLQIDLVTPITLSMVGVQGGKLVSQWVTWYNLSYTLDGQTWSMYEENGEVKVRDKEWYDWDGDGVGCRNLHNR